MSSSERRKAEAPGLEPRHLASARPLERVQGHPVRRPEAGDPLPTNRTVASHTFRGDRPPSPAVPVEQEDPSTPIGSHGPRRGSACRPGAQTALPTSSPGVAMVRHVAGADGDDAEARPLRHLGPETRGLTSAHRPSGDKDARLALLGQPHRRRPVGRSQVDELLVAGGGPPLGQEDEPPVRRQVPDRRRDRRRTARALRPPRARERTPASGVNACSRRTRPSRDTS